MKRFLLVLASLTLVACQETTSPPATPPATSSEAPDLGAAELGPAAMTTPQLWAVVSSNGTLVRGSRVFHVSHPGTGRYEVRFNTIVLGCAYVATARPTSGQAHLVYTATGHSSASGAFGVWVETRTQSNVLVNGNFNLVVTCGTPQNIRFAVINYAGTLTRASPGTAVLRPSAGRFYVHFAAPVSACSFIATVADPANQRVPFAAVVHTGSRPDANSVYVETRSGTGVLKSGVPFHLALVCPQTLSRIAVVRAVGSSQRASASTGSIRSGPGKYLVFSNRTLTTCAAVATRGSTNTVAPTPPATLEVIPGSGAKSIGFQVRRLQFSGGGLVNLDFHTAILC